MAEGFYESFDNGIGALSHVWGSADIDTSVSGQVTISGNGGIMEKPTGAATGHGYGSYTVVASIEGDSAGPAALLWPGNDKWPGPEYDIVEVINGEAYGAVHWEGSGGGDAYTTRVFEGIDESDVHRYTLDWQPGSITYYVDGENMGSVNSNIGADYAHGGTNEVFGLQNRNWNTSITVHEVSYSPSGGGGWEGDSGEEDESTGGDDDDTNNGGSNGDNDGEGERRAEARAAGDSGTAGDISDPAWQGQSEELWDAWQAAWAEHGDSGDTSWQQEFWASHDWQT